MLRTAPSSALVAATVCSISITMLACLHDGMLCSVRRQPVAAYLPRSGAAAGGMLATWMRIKYPHILDGAVAGSAPIWSYLGEVLSPSPGSSACVGSPDDGLKMSP